MTPESAEYIFVGLDANYHPGIESHPIFEHIVDYHEDGVRFWQTTGVHHPFLLPSYKGDGRRYHRAFAKVGFRTHHASLVSFVELLDLPTVGRSKLHLDDLSQAHLKRLNSAILEGNARRIFVSAGVLRLMRSSGAFPWLDRSSKVDGVLPVVFTDGVRNVYRHLHFSNYGKFDAQLKTEAQAIAAMLPQAHQTNSPSPCF
jgi:hypothetical protein